MTSLGNALDSILFDFQFNQGAFSDASLQSDERRDLAVERILNAVKDAGWGPAPFAGA